MATIIGNNSSNRLVEMLAGSTALLSDPADATSDVPLSIRSLSADDLDSATSDQTSTLRLAGTGAPLQPAFNAENAEVLGVHAALEALSHATGTSDIVHGLTTTGETIGLGKIGTVSAPVGGNTNLVTDTVNLPNTVLDHGPSVAISELGADAIDTVRAGNGLVDAALFGRDPSNPVPELIRDLGLAGQNPVSAINGIGDDVLNNGIGNLGAPILTDAGMLTNGGLLNTPLLNGIGTQDITDAPLQDITAPLQGITGEPLVTLNGGNNPSDGGLAGAVIGDLNGSSGGHHLVDVDAGPRDNGSSVDVLSTPTGADHTADINAVDVGPNTPQLADIGLANDPNQAGVPALGDTAIPALNGAGTDGLLNPDGSLVTLNGGNNAGDGGVAGGTIGDFNGSSSGHHLVDADAGPRDNGSSVDVLSTPTGADHTANINAVDVGPNTPQLADIGVANDPNQAGVPALGDAAIPALNGMGTDGLLNPDSSLVTLNGGNNAGDGGVAGGTIGDFNESSGGHHLVDADAGPRDNGSSVDVLSAPTGADHTADINAIDVGPDTPQLADIGVANNPNEAGIPALSDAGIPSFNGADTDGLLNTDAPLVTLNGGNNAGDGGAAGGTIGDFNGSSSGHHLVDADAGPRDSGSSVDVLSAPTDADHTADINAVDVGPNSPQLANVGIANHPDMINIPSLNGAGTDGLTGSIPGNTVGTAITGTEPAPVTVDLGHTADVLPVSVTGDHGILDVQGTHII